MRPGKTSSAGVLNAMLRSEYSPKGRGSHGKVFKQERDIVRCRGYSAMGTGKWGSLTSGFTEEGVMGDGVLLGRGHRVGWLWSGCVGLQQGVEVHLHMWEGWEMGRG